jgi:hypothetical protein
MTSDEIFLFVRRLEEAFNKFSSQDPITLFKQNAQLIVTEEIESTDNRRLPKDEIKIELSPETINSMEEKSETIHYMHTLM